MAEEFQQAVLCGGANYFWWNSTAPPAATADVDSTGLVLDSGFGDWNQQPHNNHLPRDGEGNFNSMLQEDTTTSISHNNSYSNETSLLKTLFEPDHHHQDGSLSLLNNARLNEISPFLQQQEASFNFTNNTPFWNATTGPALSDHSNIINNNINGPNFFPSQSQFIATAPISPKLFSTKTKTEEVRDSTAVSVKKGNGTNNNIDQPAVKRPRIETPSPLPTFKVRKEKLGDRITALQQLVSPFGKTDTASVLHEAIEYIKFLHDQVSVLSTPYMKIGAPLQHHQVSESGLGGKHLVLAFGGVKRLLTRQYAACYVYRETYPIKQFDKSEAPSHDHHHLHHHKQRKDTERGGEAKQDLRSRGLCLVPISSTFPVANETTSDFWTPTFGATFR